MIAAAKYTNSLVNSRDSALAGGKGANSTIDSRGPCPAVCRQYHAYSCTPRVGSGTRWKFRLKSRTKFWIAMSRWGGAPSQFVPPPPPKISTRRPWPANAKRS